MKKRHLFKRILLSITLSSLTCASDAGMKEIFDSFFTKTAVDVPKQQSIEVGFSPEGSAKVLVLKAIHSAKKSIRMAGYTFTSPDVVRALLEAKKRGVDVAAVVDYKNNLQDSRGASIHALSLLVNAGVPVRTISVYAIHHDKYLVIDGRHIETGSFNYTQAASQKNSENVILIWNNPFLAEKYIRHWQSRWEQGKPFTYKNY